MISASHMVVGAAVAGFCPRARVALPLALASHFVMDIVPHSCFNMMHPAAELAGVVASLGPVLAVVALAGLVALTSRMRNRSILILAAFVACLPDVWDYMHPFSAWFHMLPASSYVTWVHRNLHCDVTKSHCALGFATQLIVIWIGLSILSRRRPKSIIRSN